MIDFKDLNEKIAKLPASSVGDEVQRIVDNGPSVIATLTAIVSAYSNAYRGVQVIQRNADTGELEDVTDSDEFKDRLQIPNNVLATMWANALPAISVMADARRHSHLDETTIQSDEDYDQLDGVQGTVAELRLTVYMAWYGIYHFYKRSNGEPSISSPWNMLLRISGNFEYKGVPTKVIRAGGYVYYCVPMSSEFKQVLINGFEATLGAPKTYIDAEFDVQNGPIDAMMTSTTHSTYPTATLSGQTGCYIQTHNATTTHFGSYTQIQITGVHCGQIASQMSSGQLDINPTSEYKVIITFGLLVEGEAPIQHFVAVFHKVNDDWLAETVSTRPNLTGNNKVESCVLPLDFPAYFNVSGQMPETEADWTAVHALHTQFQYDVPHPLIVTNLAHDKVSVEGSSFDGGNAYKAAYIAIQNLIEFMEDQGLDVGLTDDMREAINWEFIEE